MKTIDGLFLMSILMERANLTEEQEILDSNHISLLDADGKPKTEEIEVVIPRFKPTTVFDISQTDGEPLETLAPEELTESVAVYDLFMKAIIAVSPFPSGW